MGEVEGIIAKFNRLAAEVSGDAVAVALEGEGGGFGDLALVPMEESLAEGGGVNRPGSGLRLLAETFEGSLTDF